MEFGALQCRPGIPDCSACPFHKSCFACLNNSIADFPVKLKIQTQRTRYFHYLVITAKSKNDSIIYLKKRTGNDIWKNLFDFPLIETAKPVSLKKLVISDEWKEIAGPSCKVISESKVHRHILSHQVILAKFYILEVPPGTKLPYYKVLLKELDKYPVPRLIEIFLKNRKSFFTYPC